ncbi:uncharacterized protein PV09_04010 [Verruconis gallopava]|uniref:Osmotin, thaumatin-like protein n=1 Tax=Verruconis gallopava TaxID=253628 RepID=A0A0D1XQD5_9PEZI|nr:uncharacterized protein PV09_04010 [Verruconis gallopava]KIW04826.1 hypothetical protein PV09_04010 [Verruconis gallopava]
MAVGFAQTHSLGAPRALSSTTITSRGVRRLSLRSVLILLQCLSQVQAIHHMQRRAPRRLVPRQYPNTTPLHITNLCSEDIYPGINTQSGKGPADTGFKLSPGETRELVVSENWQGRVWGRTNCSFNADGTRPSNGSPGKACGSGDCNGMLACKVGGDVPVTLAEFTLNAGDDQSYYDISLVDGYNIPMAIVLEPHGNFTLDELPPNLTNPTCSGTAELLAPQDWMPYANGQTFLNTNSSYPLPLDFNVNYQQVLNWCPWELQLNMPQPPNDGKYMYPDNSVQRQAFNPCFSACAKWNLPQDCCTGTYNSPSACQPSEYSKNAKAVCPDAYSYAFDDQTSTFIVPSGAGFNIIFCPGGRSSNILATELHNVSSTSSGQISVGGSQNGKLLENVLIGDHHKVPGNEHVGSDLPGIFNHGAEGEFSISLRERQKSEDYDWSEVGDFEEPITGVRVVDLVRRGLHLIDWEEKRMRKLEAKHQPGHVFLSHIRSSASAVATNGEIQSITWYLMAAGLMLTAFVFMML